MAFKGSKAILAIGICASALSAGIIAILNAQQPAAGRGGGGGRGGGRGAGASLFTGVDANKNGSVSRQELKAAFAKWLADSKADAMTLEQLTAALTAALPEPATPTGFGGRGAQNQTPNPEDVQKMMAALPDKAPAKSRRPRRILVLGKCVGFVHSCIPLAARTIQEIGKKTGAWTANVTYDSADINAENLKQYDLVLLNNTTGNFLDDPANPAETAARRKLLLDFVRSGKGLVGIHAATDAYHETERPTPTAAAPGATGTPGGPALSGFGAGRGVSGMLAGQIMAAGDRNTDKRLDAQELNALADAWFDKLDPERTDAVLQQDFAARFASVVPQPAANPGRAAGAAPRAPAQGPDRVVPTWLDYNTMIGGMFKFHWNDPQLITVKIDDPDSPITAMFHKQPFEIHDETYTFGMKVWSRENLRVLTSVDYSKMSAEDKAKEAYPRADQDYGLSWIRREARGRVYYEAHGHSERVYAIKPMLEHLTAGIQYALGDLNAKDEPSVKRRK